MTAIVFDLDGTLIDSLPDLHRALNATLTGAGLPGVSMTETRGFIGNGIPALVGLACDARGVPAEARAELTAAMFHHYMAAPVALTRPYPGVVAALNALAAAGHGLGLCTNKALAPTRAILADLGLAEHFAVVIAGDSLPVKKPDPAPLHAALAALPPGPALFVGDSEVDCATATAARVDFALFTEGYRKSAPEDLPHRLRFDDFAALPGLVAGL